MARIRELAGQRWEPCNRPRVLRWCCATSSRAGQKHEAIGSELDRIAVAGLNGYLLGAGATRRRQRRVDGEQPQLGEVGRQVRRRAASAAPANLGPVTQQESGG